MVFSKKIIIASMLFAGIFSNSIASAESGPNPYSDCGIGAALFPNTAWAAVSSNVIWDVGTTAVISATASPDTCSDTSATAAKFIFDAYENVIADTAQGDGQYLTALMDIYTCDGNQDELMSSLRTEVGAQVANPTYTEMNQLQKAEDYFNVIDSKVRSEAFSGCSA